METVLIIAAIAVAVIAFFVGFSKAFSRLSWGALMWGIVVAVWLTLETKLKENPVLNMVKGVNLFEGSAQFIASVGLFVAIALVVFIVFGILSLILRPNYAKRNVVNNYVYNPKDDEYDPYIGSMCAHKGVAEGYEQAEDESAEEWKKEVKPKRTGPNLFDRIFGGIIAIVEATIVLLGVAAVALVVLKFTSLSKSMSGLYTGALAEDGKIWKMLHPIAVDVLFTAIIMGMAYGGYKAGFLRGVKGVVSTFGMLTAFALACALPFVGTPLATKFNGFFARFIKNNVKVEFLVKYSEIAGKVLSGVLLFILLAIAVKIVSTLLELLCKATRSKGLFKFVDGALGLVAMIAIGLIVCILICAVLYILEYTGAKFKFSALFTENSKIVKGINGLLNEFLKPLMDKWIQPSLAA